MTRALAHLALLTALGLGVLSQGAPHASAPSADRPAGDRPTSPWAPGRREMAAAGGPAPKGSVRWLPLAAPQATPPTHDVGPVDWGDPSPAPVVHAPSAFGRAYPPATQAARDWAWRRIGTRQFRCLDSLWHHESGWRVLAHNPSSGAHGIPQALPGSRMASAGADWRTSAMTQVRWGLGYVSGRYGSACAAEAHRARLGWY